MAEWKRCIRQSREGIVTEQQAISDFEFGQYDAVYTIQGDTFTTG